MKIGDEVYIHGYVDEIRGATVIIKNKGGYFGTSKREVVSDKPEEPFAHIVYPMDDFSVIVHEGNIIVTNKKMETVTVTLEEKRFVDCAWKEPK